MRTAGAIAIAITLALGHAGSAQETAPQERARVTRIDFRPATVEEGGGILITLAGSGRCTYAIDYGDGQSEKRTANLPDEVRHHYVPGKAYDVVATPEAPCEGVARARIDVNAIERGIWRVNAELASSTAPEIVVAIDGRGACTVYVDFGDGQTEKHDLTLPAKVPHKYQKGGTYEIAARTQDPCRGDGRVRIEIKSQLPIANLQLLKLPILNGQLPTERTPNRANSQPIVLEVVSWPLELARLEVGSWRVGS